MRRHLPLWTVLAIALTVFLFFVHVLVVSFAEDCGLRDSRIGCSKFYEDVAGPAIVWVMFFVSCTLAVMTVRDFFARRSARD